MQGHPALWCDVCFDHVAVSLSVASVRLAFRVSLRALAMFRVSASLKIAWPRFGTVDMTLDPLPVRGVTASWALVTSPI